MTSGTNSGRIFRYAAIAWLAMLTIMCVSAFALASIKGTGDPDMSGPMELVFVFAMVSWAPFAIGSFGVMAPIGVLIDRWLAARTSRPVNVLAGALLALPALLAWLVAGTLLWSKRGLIENVSGFFHARYRVEQIFLVSILFIGGAIIGLAFRRRA